MLPLLRGFHQLGPDGIQLHVEHAAVRQNAGLEALAPESLQCSRSQASSIQRLSIFSLPG